MMSKLARIKKLEARLREREVLQAGSEPVCIPWEHLVITGDASPSAEAQERRLEGALRSAERRYAEAATRSPAWAAYREQCARLGIEPQQPSLFDDLCPIEEALRMLAI